MMALPRSTRRMLGSEILRSVSRSFYLSIRVLPSGLREPIALAYLLARATDTIADTAAIAADTRRAQLLLLAQIIQNERPVEEAEIIRDAIAPLQTSVSERALLQAVPRCIEWLHSLAARDRDEVRNVLRKINRGQVLDVGRFGDSSEIRALQTAGELHEYTYLVAGCVGEFWTRVCLMHVNFTERAADEMMELGVRYGCGLQLVNILRDIGGDLRAGRCYLPLDQLHSLGLEPGEILENPARLEPLLAEWRQKARAGMAAGVEYSCEIRNARVRFATALPALIGARTLTLLDRAGGNVVQQTVKVSRREVRNIMMTTALTLAGPPALRSALTRLSR